uniref:Secreted protein n=1 Tax=Rhodosorus marinus TaxID=101924 RepID=A0A7S3EQW4_9RHOD|mmetsp:Transcript_9527/g.41146  ORF Transcript_9527/g.41146 Transcript_9527/m.41146 type:complete len:103 (+) Transcript_9527:167-475(+)|eukprot:CAMPEP_0113973454 /NCGR_PEP_ID=MMETSP0011_2-20120614/14500_1 /TAXON_ID=101924 /ORGANISM="Rhodosorus marinus" /LENGTH=102 /DNA_ID=CAMNT_0000991461 /DNA_START=65 /DNA_END=373 /DNA_ORIENTATION=+ /assembly_acc=CAM_ASM_000156
MESVMLRWVLLLGSCYRDTDGNQSGSARNPVALGGSEQLGHTFKHGIVKHAFGSDVPELSLSDHLDRGSDALSSSSGDQIMKTFRGFFHEQQRVCHAHAHAT